MIDPGVRSVQIALLGRRPIALLSRDDLSAFADHRVMITGAAGRVGRELARRLARCEPDRLVLFDRAEAALAGLEDELIARWPKLPLEVILGDVTRPRSIRDACERVQPHVVYHAAAHGDVAITERAVCETVRCHVLGTANALTAAGASGADLVLISTDQAARPRSVVGATRRMAELLTELPLIPELRTVVVRLGSVLGSRSSQLPQMIECLRTGRSVALPHPESTRHFMTPGEAAALAMKADLLGRPSETYRLDVGPPQKMGTLAERVLRVAEQAGHRPVSLEPVGPGPGETPREDADVQETCRFARDVACEDLLVAPRAEHDRDRVERLLRALRHDLTRSDPLSALIDLQAAVLGFEPSRVAWETAAEAAMGAIPIPETRWWGERTA